MKPRASVWPQRFVQWEPEPVGQVGPWGSHQAPVFPSRLQGVMGGSEHPAEPGPVSMGPGPGLGSAQRQPYSGSSEEMGFSAQQLPAHTQRSSPRAHGPSGHQGDREAATAEGVREREVPADPREGGRQGGLSSHSSAWRLRVLPCFLPWGACVNPQGQAWFVQRPSLTASGGVSAAPGRCNST